jgi:hypothetical protein
MIEPTFANDGKRGTATYCRSTRSGVAGPRAKYMPESGGLTVLCRLTQAEETPKCGGVSAATMRKLITAGRKKSLKMPLRNVQKGRLISGNSTLDRCATNVDAFRSIDGGGRAQVMQQ